MKTDIRKITEGFGSVSETVYGPAYGHPPESHTFFDAVLRAAVSRHPGGDPIRALEIGCGNGYWLRSVVRALEGTGSGVDLFGLDVTPALIERAREELKDLLPPSSLSLCDILGGHVAGSYHLCYAYDLVQQIDPRDHPLLLSRVRSLLVPGGRFVVFDRDPRSRYGIRMIVRKFLTRRLKLRLVPDFYLLARYPSFRRLARLARRAGFDVVDDLRGPGRRALVLKA